MTDNTSGALRSEKNGNFTQVTNEGEHVIELEWQGFRAELKPGESRQIVTYIFERLSARRKA